MPSPTWKDKILDYEIEITNPDIENSLVVAWKDKILDYEIEIYFSFFGQTWSGIAWKDKILDYEIEIFSSRWGFGFAPRLEKIRFSITRLKWT